MGWGTDFKTDIYLNRMIFNSKGELEDKIEELEKGITTCKEKLLMFASSTPKDIIPDDWKEESIRFINDSVTEIIDEMLEEKKILTDLQYYLEEYDTIAWQEPNREVN